MLIGFIFAVTETIYFGSNWLPESKEEVACDIIAAAICLYGLGLLMFGKDE